MFVIRASLLLLVVVSLVWCEGAGDRGESRNDRMDDLFSLMYNIGKRVDSTAEHMLKTEDRVSEIVTKVGKIDI